MAVYGKYKESWNPLKQKTKTSKNKTYELKKASSLGGTYVASDSLYSYIATESIFDGGGSKYYLRGPHQIATSKLSIPSFPLQVTGHEYTDIVSIDNLRFPKKAIKFHKVPNGGSFRRSFVHHETANSGGYTAEILNDVRGYTTYISFWLKIDLQDFDGSDGHSFGGLYRAGENANDTTSVATLDPFVVFSISSTGQLITRYIEPIEPGDSGGGGTTWSPGHVTWQTSAADHTIGVNKWIHCTVAFTPLSSYGSSNVNLINSLKVWFDGNSVDVSGQNFGSTMAKNTASLEWRLGNTAATFDDRVNAAMNLSDGFAGSLGEILLVSQSHTTPAQWNNFAKFLYEAQHDGVYNLHSGIHSSTPRLELMDLDKDTAYPSNFSMENYTKFDSNTYFSKKDRTSLSSKSQYVEGYNASDASYTWKENASQYYVQSNTILPHLRLSTNDTLLTNGNWYSDARSEFFAEDLHNTTGFVIKRQSSDELYREHYTEEKTTPFIDENVPPEYKDCMIIEIPLPNANALTLTTDGDSNSERSFHTQAGGFQTTNQSINTMAYYNFNTGQWQNTVTAYSTAGANPTIGGFNWVEKSDIGFTPMTGLVLPKDQYEIEYIVDNYGRPTSDFGFPFAERFKSSAGQSIDMSAYIDEPVVLEGWEIYQKVVPKVGYQHGTNGNTANGPTEFYDTVNTYSEELTTGTRNKYFYSPSSGVTAGSNFPTTGVALADFGYIDSRIDVYFNGDIMKKGTSIEVNNGTADYTIGTDISNVGQLVFRFNLTTSDVITMITRTSVGDVQRYKVYASPTGTITAGTGFAAGSVNWGTSIFANPQHELDVFLNGELQRYGTSTQVTNGTADFTVNSSGQLVFRYNLSASAQLTILGEVAAPADETNEVAGVKTKFQGNPSGTIGIGSPFGVTGMALNDFGNYSANNIDVYLNGEIQKQGTNTEVNNGTADFYISTDVGGAGQLYFRYVLQTTDSIIVQGQNMGVAVTTTTPGVQPGRNAFSYGGHGHATVMWDYRTSASPFEEKAYIDSDGGKWYHNNTVPVGTTGSVKASPSIITKGVTAFLLKESSLLAPDERLAAFHNQKRTFSISTNLSSSNGTYTAPAVGTAITESFDPQADAGYSFSFQNRSYFDTTSTRQLIGYLQHVYHNDTAPTGSRSDVDWVRYDGADQIGVVPKYSNQLNLVGILDRENETYISDILRVNSTSYDFHVSGSMKLNTPMATSFPITNFKVDDLFNVTNISDPQNNNRFYAESIYPSNEGGVDNQLINAEFVPSVSGLREVDSITLPISSIPFTTGSATTSELSTWRTTRVFEAAASKNSLQLAETVISPHDKLILGIQDSISTCFASQMKKNDIATSPDNDQDYIRWGRGSLQIPAQNDAYLRLYIKRTREDKTFNIVSDSSRYNESVFRDLGDQFVDDDHILTTPIMYSGSTADDIIYKTYGSAPVLKQKIVKNETNASPFLRNPQVIAYMLYAFGAADAVATPDSYVSNLFSPNRNWTDNDFKIDWRALSQRAYFNYLDGTNRVSLPIDILDNKWFQGIAIESYRTALATIVHPQNLAWEYSTSATTNVPYLNWNNPMGDNTYSADAAGIGTLMPLEVVNQEQDNYNYEAFTYKNQAGATKTRNFGWSGRHVPAGAKSNAIAAWYQRLVLPYLQKNPAYFEPSVQTLELDLKVVQVGWWTTPANLSSRNNAKKIPWSHTGGTNTGNWSVDSNSPSGYALKAVEQPWIDKRPVATEINGVAEELAIGDAFYFDHSGNCIKLKSYTELQTLDTVNNNQRWWKYNDFNSVGKKSEMKFSFDHEDSERFFADLEFQENNTYYKIEFSNNKATGGFSSSSGTFALVNGGAANSATNPKRLRVDVGTDIIRVRDTDIDAIKAISWGSATINIKLSKTGYRNIAGNNVPIEFAAGTPAATWDDTNGKLIITYQNNNANSTATIIRGLINSISGITASFTGDGAQQSGSQVNTSFTGGLANVDTYLTNNGQTAWVQQFRNWMNAEFGARYDVTYSAVRESDGRTRGVWVKLVQKTVNPTLGFKNYKLALTKVIEFAPIGGGVDVNPEISATQAIMTEGSTKDRQTIFIVGREGPLIKIDDINSNLGGSSWDSIIDPSHAATETYTYEQIYAKIADVLNAAKHLETAFLGTARANQGDNFLEITYPDDVTLRKVFSAYKSSIDSASTFELAGLVGFGSNTYAGLDKIYLKPTNLIRSYTNHFMRAGFFASDSSSASHNGARVYQNIPENHFMETYNAAFYVNNPSTYGNYAITLTSSQTTDFDSDGSTSTQTTPWIIPLGNVSDRPMGITKTADQNYIQGYFPRWRYKTATNRGRSYSLIPSRTWSSEFEAMVYPLDSNGDSTVVTNGYSFGLDFSSVPSAGFVIEITDETYSPLVSEIIDRKVAFRTTTGNAGPFGSLNAFLQLSPDSEIFDSLPPKLALWQNTSLNLTTAGIPTGWLLDTESEKFVSGIKLLNVYTNLKTSGPAGYETQYDIDPSSFTLPVVRTSLDLDESGTSNWSFATSTDSGGNWPLKNTGGQFNVTNYLEKEFGENTTSYRMKTGKDLVLGFGNSPQGIHTVRPATYKYKALNSSNSVASTSLVTELIIDRPRGSRFGLYNTETHKPRYVFSYRSYGQLRDMIEQGVDTKFTNHSVDEQLYGAPVVVNPVNPINPEVPKLMENTSRYNKTTNAVVTKPYIEDNYEATPQPNRLRDERLRVDVAGSIRQRSITAPGNVAANIRSR